MLLYIKSVFIKNFGNDFILYSRKLSVGLKTKKNKFGVLGFLKLITVDILTVDIRFIY